jgi:hypothetical protein
MLNWLRGQLGPGWPTFRLGLLAVGVAASGFGLAVVTGIRAHSFWSIFLFVVVAAAVLAGMGSIIYGWIQMNRWANEQTKVRRDAP